MMRDSKRTCFESSQVNLGTEHWQPHICDLINYYIPVSTYVVFVFSWRCRSYVITSIIIIIFSCASLFFHLRC